ncbi:hypothetical protein C0993_003140 [Termitomyces sp. T159_Od127]|nr:hypothetical protein C0993_003140 [Termitomyces sp. T159_Od127]
MLMATSAPVTLTAPQALGVQKVLVSDDEEMGEVPLIRDKIVPLDAGGAAPPLKRTAGPPRRGPPATSQASDALGPSKTYWGQKPPLDASQLEIVDFPANILEWAEAAQMLFMKAIVLLALPEQVIVVALTTDPCTPAQYNRIVATTAAKKGKHCEAPPVNNNSNYGELQSKEEEEEEEGKTPAQHFQHVQQNKKIAKKKANKTKAVATLAHQAQNNFSGHISHGLGVTI